MLRVHAAAQPSAIHGNGLFARQFIAAGEVIWAFDPPFDVRFTEEQLQALPPPAQQQALYYSSFEKHCGCYLLTGDDDRFMNHSDTPNALDHGDVITAIRDIQPGEEITLDYNQLGYSFRSK
ncbi:MAG: SET domain-containing protein [Verrucomicrobiaceae bacterium]|nr:SET domain-containing protein [Verrucomicrobiaceae bacterium]